MSEELTIEHPEGPEAADVDKRHHHCQTVTVHVNNKEVFLHEGHYPVATLKKVSGVPLADDLDELVDCTLKPLPDDGSVTIHGCEIFVSHVKDGGSS